MQHGKAEHRNKERKHLGFLSIFISLLESCFSYPGIFSTVLSAVFKNLSWRTRCSSCHRMCHQLQLLLASHTVSAAGLLQQSRTNVRRTLQLVLSFTCGLGSCATGEVFIVAVVT